MLGSAFSNSSSRSIAPAARCNSPHVSLSIAADIATNMAYSTNWPSSPPVISPASTARAPIHNTTISAANRPLVADIENAARARTRRTAVSKLMRIDSPKRRLSSSSAVNDCTVCAADSVSVASPLASAIVSCDARDRRRTQRPISTIGTSTAGISTTM